MIRLATPSDLKQCLRMAENFHKASPYNKEEFSVQKCTQIFESYLSGDKTGLIIILSEGSSVNGMIIGMSSELPFSDAKVATELVWWVDPEARGSKDSLMLFKAFEEWSRRIGARVTAMAMLDDVTDLSGFYQRQGYESAERTFLKRNN